MSRKNWADFDWRLLKAESLEPAVQVALDDVLLDELVSGRRGAMLRFWEWPSSAIVIGRFQSLRNEVDTDAARRLGVGVVRRISGGGAMFMEPGNIITYSIYAPLSLVEGMSIQESYALMDAWVLDGLARLGIKAWYQPLNDITSESGKIAGAAQARRRGAFVHHTTMAYDIDAAKMVQVLRIGREKLSDKGTTSAVKRVDPLRSQTGLPRAKIIESLIASFRDAYGLTDDALRLEELQRAQELVASKYATPEWVGVVP